MLTSRYDEAFRYAHELHRAQRRKGTAIPYISHLMTSPRSSLNMEAVRIRRSAPFCTMRQRIRVVQKHWRRSGHGSATPSQKSFPTARIHGMSPSRNGNRVRKLIWRNYRPSRPNHCSSLSRTRRTTLKPFFSTTAFWAMSFGGGSTAAPWVPAGTTSHWPISSEGDARPLARQALARGDGVLGLKS
jgi:hypothetical protein